MCYYYLLLRTQRSRWVSRALQVLGMVALLLTPISPVAAAPIVTPLAAQEETPSTTTSLLLPSLMRVDQVTGSEISAKAHLPLVNNNQCRGLRPATMPIGTQIYGNSGVTSPYFTAIHTSYSSWLRVIVNWNQVEPEERSPRSYRWGTVDQAFAAARDSCMNILAIVERTPQWARQYPGLEIIREDKLDAFAEFMAALATRYGGNGTNGMVVTHFELYNEPDRRFSWGDARTGETPGPVRYAEMLKKVYPAVKAANPAAQIVLGGLAYDLFTSHGGGFVESFLDDVLAAGGGPYFDYMNFHCYPFPNVCRTHAARQSSGLIEKNATLNAKLQAHQLTKPLMITEIGWHRESDDEFAPSNDELQARKMVQLLTQSRALDAKVIIWWMLNDPRPLYPHDSGLYSKAPEVTARPVLRVYRHFISRAGAAEYLGVTSPHDSPTDLEGYRFRNRQTGQIFHIAWLNPVDDFGTTTKPLRVPGARATVLNVNGTQIATVLDSDDGDADGHVTIQVGGSPLFILIN